MNDDRGSGLDVPAIGFSYSVVVGDGRSLVAQTHVPQSASAAEINAVIDKLRKVADRQLEFGKIEDLEKGLLQLDSTEKQLVDGIEAVDKKVAALMQDGTVTRGGQGPHQRGAVNGKAAAQAEDIARKNAVVSLEMTRRNREELSAKIEARRAELG